MDEAKKIEKKLEDSLSKVASNLDKIKNLQNILKNNKKEEN